MEALYLFLKKLLALTSISASYKAVLESFIESLKKVITEAK